MTTKPNTTVAEKPLPVPAVYKIKIPHGLPKLDGTLTRKERVEVAMDVIAVLNSRQRKFQLASTYFAPAADLPSTGQLHSSIIKGECLVCARGMMFIKSVDRFDNYDLRKEHGKVTSTDVIDRTADEWGGDQVELIECAFELDGSDYDACDFGEQHGGRENRKAVLRAICQNIIENHGEFRP